MHNRLADLQTMEKANLSGMFLSLGLVAELEFVVFAVLYEPEDKRWADNTRPQL